MFGIIAGLIDVIPMIILGLSWDANLSAFFMWIIVGFLIATSNIKINSILKGILISFLVLIPIAILIAWSEPLSLIQIIIMTLILSSFLGFCIERFGEIQKDSE